MNPDDIFNVLDVNKDGTLSRLEIHDAAKRLRWHWREAPIYAALDFLTVKNNLTRNQFISYMHQIYNDPYGPYGEVLLNQDFIYSESSKAFVIIDPQQSFTAGVWRESIPDDEIKPIRIAFDNCAKFLKENYGNMNIMFSRCPFPIDSYEWDESIRGILDDKQLYFIKPGNSILIPHTNGFTDWIIKSRIESLIIGGCTLNSCIRVSAVEIKKKFPTLKIMVDLSLSGARSSNYQSAELFDGLSPVEAAKQEMIDAGVVVVDSIQ
jgi:hypothetical protein